jgi:hypothetical protein
VKPTLFLRISAASGVLFVVLWFGAFFFSGGFPDLAISPTELASDYVHNAGRLWVGDHMSRLSIVFLVLFLAGLWLVLKRSEAGTGWLSAVALGSGLLFAGLVLLGLLFPAVARELGACAGGAPPASGCDFGRQRVDAYLFSVLYSLTGAVDILALTPLSVLLGAVAAVVIWKRALPRWLGWSSAGLAILVLAASVFDVIFPTYLLFSLWVLGTSAVLVRLRV